jgi:hypothetical protein
MLSIPTKQKDNTMKVKRLFILTAVSLCTLSSLIWSVELPSDHDASQAKITFLDGTTLKVDKLIFVYRWSNRRQAINWSETRSNDFHYQKKVKNVELDQVIPGKKIKLMELSYPKPNISGEYRYFTPDEIKITLIDGTKITVPKSDLAAVSVFLLGIPLEEITYKTFFNALEIEGDATIEDQRGRFRGRLAAEQGQLLKESETIKKVLFLNTEKQP